MYVRLKHGLSALALEAVRSRAGSTQRSRVGWLVAFCDLAAPRPAGADRETRTPHLGGGYRVPFMDVAGRGYRAPLAKVAHRARTLGGDGIRPLDWILRKGLIDREDNALALPLPFHPHFDYMNRQVHRLAAVLRRLSASPPARGRAATIRKGAALFNGGLFFECHEYFEDIWRPAPSTDKPFYQGIILVAAAFYHYEKGNLHGVRTKLAAGIEKLQCDLPATHGVRVDRWLALLAPWKARVDAGLPAGALEVAEIPKIPLARTSR
ncbi:MAG: DUF309 domain-containing protein [Armatimonadota bacterium]